MNIANQILIAFIIDLCLGDPKNWPHPVILIGHTAKWLEHKTKINFKNNYLAGGITFVITILTASLSCFLICHISYFLSKTIGDIISIFIIYTTISVKSLWQHSMNVYYSLKRKDLASSRNNVSKIVSRDTQNMDSSSIIRATVETVSENIVDGITAPLFFAFIFGPIGAISYKAINTLDSLFGYKNEQYNEFGFISAKVDDFTNYIPARITIPFIFIACLTLLKSPINAIKTMVKDYNKTASPNAGYAESLVAGSLRIQLGGNSSYFGKLLKKPTIGNNILKLKRKNILEVNKIMFLTSLFYLITLWRVFSI